MLVWAHEFNPKQQVQQFKQTPKEFAEIGHPSWVPREVALAAARVGAPFVKHTKAHTKRRRAFCAINVVYLNF